MNNVIEEKLIKNAFIGVITKGEYPNFGSPECKCDKCMFYKVACVPPSGYVGCLGGWKREEE